MTLVDLKQAASAVLLLLLLLVVVVGSKFDFGCGFGFFLLGLGDLLRCQALLPSLARLSGYVVGSQ